MSFFQYDLEDKVKNTHELWDINETISFASLAYRLKDLETEKGRQGHGIEMGIRGIYLQFHYDLSDRQMEGRLRYDIAFRWFCGFNFDDETADHSFFCRFRKLEGTKRIGKLFKVIIKKAEDKGLLRQMFTFVDARAIETKQTTWEERDKALKAGEEKLNNKNVTKYSADKDARFGCKGKKKFCFGYKETNAVEMGSGLIQAVAVTSAHVPDQKAFKHVCPRERIIFADKSYCLDIAQQEMKKKNCQSAAILKRHMKEKNKDRDRWCSQVRAPFEGVFSKRPKRSRYRGLAKVQMQAFLQAIVFNVKRLLVMESPPLWA